jgi:hypothetical protein
MIGTHIIVGDVTLARCSFTQVRSSTVRVSLMHFPRKHPLPFRRMLNGIIIRKHDVAHVEGIDITESNDGHQSITQKIDMIFEKTGFLGQNVNFPFVV